MPNKQSKRNAWAIILVVGSFGAVFLLISAGSFIMSTQAQSWPVTDGTITYVSVMHSSHSADLFVWYEFQVNGETYRGYRVCYGDQPDADDFASAHPVGSTVEVHYNPNNPSSCVLETRLTSDDLTFFFLGLFLASSALIYAAYVIKSKRKE
jgi:hypothetical protein